MKKILIIDDNSPVAELMKNMLQGDFEVAIDTGPEWLKTLKDRGLFDVVITNYLRSDMACVHAIGLIREAQPSCRVIVVTGAVESAVEAEVRAAGADGFLEKPFSYQKLKEIVGIALSIAVE